jgi:hypothetical protein
MFDYNLNPQILLAQAEKSKDLSVSTGEISPEVVTAVQDTDNFRMNICQKKTLSKAEASELMKKIDNTIAKIQKETQILTLAQKGIERLSSPFINNRPFITNEYTMGVQECVINTCVHLQKGGKASFLVASSQSRVFTVFKQEGGADNLKAIDSLQKSAVEILDFINNNTAIDDIAAYARKKHAVQFSQPHPNSLLDPAMYTRGNGSVHMLKDAFVRYNINISKNNISTIAECSTDQISRIAKYAGQRNAQTMRAIYEPTKDASSFDQFFENYQ